MTAPPAAGSHIASLDGIRAVAALIVFISHCGLQQIVPGLFGVTIFFFLSGYLITTLLRLEYERHGRISLKNFYLRRIYRIIPPMYIVLLLLLVPYVQGDTRNDVMIGGVVAQFAHLTNYYIIAFGGDTLVPGSGPMWSLAVEEHFYLLYPLALIFLLKRWKYSVIARALAAVCLCVLAWRYWLHYGLGASVDYTNMATDARIDSLLFGCIMGVWLNPALDRQLTNVPKVAWFVILGIAGCALLASFAFRSEGFRETLRFTVQGIALFPIFFCSVRFSHWPVFSWLNLRPVRAFGLVSYTFYLVHLKILQIAGRYIEGDGLVWALAAFALSVAVSAVMYWLVERPLQVLRQELHTSAVGQTAGRGSGALSRAVARRTPSA